MKYVILALFSMFLSACAEVEDTQAQKNDQELGTSTPALTGDGGYNDESMELIIKRLNASIEKGRAKE